MSDIIKLLPDSVANQIAAGEVIQRPASAVKELLENAVDAGSTKIQLIIKDSGKTLIQVVDNGKGMSFHDARMSFERHATSKIESADDLFKITTKGFRGEALASIAAIAQVEMKTRQSEESVGTLLVNEGSTVKEHSPVAAPEGTSISVKNLFYNVPARRNFLKSDAIEFSHIEEEFYRVALIHTDVAFTLIHNEKTILQLPPSNFKQRIINIFGPHLKDKLYPIEQITDHVEISGFIAKPENAKKKKNDQYMFFNQRYVRHNLLNFAVEKAYTELIPEGYKPSYFIRLTVDPATIDINISPTKVDIKLQDERLVFGFLNSTVKKSLGDLALIPQLDFEKEGAFDFPDLPKNTPIVPPQITRNPNYNPFENNPAVRNKDFSSVFKKEEKRGEGWNDFLAGIKTTTVNVPENQGKQSIPFSDQEENDHPLNLDESLQYVLIANQYLIFEMKGQLAIVDIVTARERILYEQFMKAMRDKQIVIQQNLFPETITLTPGNADVLNEIKDELYQLGYDIECMGNNQFAVNGIPQGSENENVQQTIEGLVESYKCNTFLYRNDKEKNISLSLCKQKRSQFHAPQNELEARAFLQQLLDCEVPYTGPSGQKIIHLTGIEAIRQLFR